MAGLKTVLHSYSATVLQSQQSEKYLAYQYTAFFDDKIVNVHDSLPTFTSCDTSTMHKPSSLLVYNYISEDQVSKIISKQTTRSFANFFMSKQLSVANYNYHRLRKSITTNFHSFTITVTNRKKFNYNSITEKSKKTFGIKFISLCDY